MMKKCYGKIFLFTGKRRNDSFGMSQKKKVHDLLGLFTVRKENSGAGNSGKEEKQKK